MKIAQQTQKYLQRLIEDCGRIELRRIAPIRKHNRIRWFEDVEALWQQARNWSGDGISLLTSINAPVEGYPRNRGLRDKGVARYRRLLFDFDPVRDTPASTDRQHALAIAQRDEFVATMSSQGWPTPVLASSGNGAHAQYRVDMEVDQKIPVVDMYRGMAQAFSTPGVTFDVTTANPATLCRLYGTLNRKGNPQRLSHCVVPKEYLPIPAEPLNHALALYNVRKPKRTAEQSMQLKDDVRSRDIVAWFKSVGLYRFPLLDGKHSVICPWAGSDHEVSCPTDTVIWETSTTGYPQFHCSHSSCDGRWMGDIVERLS